MICSKVPSYSELRISSRFFFLLRDVQVWEIVRRPSSFSESCATGEKARSPPSFLWRFAGRGTLFFRVLSFPTVDHTGTAEPLSPTINPGHEVPFLFSPSPFGRFSSGCAGPGPPRSCSLPLGSRQDQLLFFFLEGGRSLVLFLPR